MSESSAFFDPGAALPAAGREADELPQANASSEHGADLTEDVWQSVRWDDGDAFDNDSFLEDDPWHADEATEDAAQAPSAEQIQALLGQLAAPAASSSETLAMDRQQVPHVLQNLDAELRTAFLDDAASCLATIEAALLQLESVPRDTAPQQQICRELHTLKGAAGSVGLDALAEQLHRTEDTLREHQQQGTAPDVDGLLKQFDEIRNGLWQDPSHHGTELPPSSPLRPCQAETALLPKTDPVSPATELPPTATDSGDTAVRVQTSQLNRLMDMLAELVMLQNRRQSQLAVLQEAHRSLVGCVSKLRVLGDQHRSDAAAGELQMSEVASDVLEIAQNVRGCSRPLSEQNSAITQFIGQFRQELVALRRSPIDGLFQRLQRVVRDASHSEQKNVRLRLLGTEACIERSLQQRLYEPLLHLVRNAVCHGIESPPQRIAAGKPATGTITLTATAGPDLFSIDIDDDGAGLDYSAIRRRAIQAGLLSGSANPTHQQLAQLIFHPGLSTRDAADQMAGRGVGMDVVADTLQRMRGWLEIDSVAGRGTSVRLRFPLPSLIQHVMVFQSGGQRFALPTHAVAGAGETTAEDHTADSITFSRLLDSHSINPDSFGQTIRLNRRPATRTDGGDTNKLAPHQTCVLVDQVVGPEEVVVRPLPPLLRSHPFCVGATLSVVGEVMLLVDPHRLPTAGHPSPEPDLAGEIPNHTTNQLPAPTDRAAPADRVQDPTVLVVDDSLSARKRTIRALRGYAWNILEASDGEEALALLKTTSVAAVITDMEMPRVDGMALLAAVAAMDGHRGTPVVVLSSRQDASVRAEAQRLGAAAYLAKPLQAADLDAAFQSLSRERRLSIPEPTNPTSAGVTA